MAAHKNNWIDPMPEDAYIIGRNIPNEASIIGGLFFGIEAAFYYSVAGYSVPATITEAKRLDKKANCWEIKGLLKDGSRQFPYRAQFQIIQQRGWIQYLESL